WYSGRVIVHAEATQVRGAPGDRFLEPFIEAISWLPVPKRMCQGRAGEQAFHLAGRRANAVGFRLDIERPAQQPADPFDELADRNILAPADIDDASDRLVATGDRNECPGRVLDEREVPPRVEPTQFHERPAQGLADDRRNDGAG